ncbi:hypothetical protein E1202_16705 [Saccharopolyspora karakumensis]|uniref:Putative Flp pilus-assembly TadG-like N-terminal domain-containing protein n=1 Tax=Saccharopolyspora karakumensis TaxID=2530386 RepID=A0A4R5BL92_9PSEU|nr:Rv3654c family TadE-like protein [Saccharopolyspora karakumensis]TDD87451.1 hypothetical protein E1202_16705 [Saccharopolyspora karakumensis]
MNDRGSATVLAAVLSLVVLVLLGWLVQLGAATAARQRAEGAADLAALAAAAHVIGGPEHACAQARRVTGGMRTHLLTCTLTGREVRVEVAGELAGRQPPSARARAGPAPVEPRVSRGQYDERSASGPVGSGAVGEAPPAPLPGFQRVC